MVQVGGQGHTMTFDKSVINHKRVHGLGKEQLSLSLVQSVSLLHEMTKMGSVEGGDCNAF